MYHVEEETLPLERVGENLLFVIQPGWSCTWMPCFVPKEVF